MIIRPVVRKSDYLKLSELVEENLTNYLKYQRTYSVYNPRENFVNLTTGV